MELTPEQIAEKTHGFWDHYYMYTRDWPAEKVIEEISKLIREYGEQQLQQGMIVGFKNVTDWATYNINGLKENNENLIV